MTCDLESAVLAYAIAAVSPTMDIANAALPAYVTSLLFFVGLLLRVQDQPNYWKWCVPSAVSGSSKNFSKKDCRHFALASFDL